MIHDRDTHELWVAQPPDALRILHVEDCLEDRELVRAALGSDDLVCDIVYAATGAEFATRLGGEKFDLILSDFSMPGFSGREALALAKEIRPGVPFLFVSGAIGEERAIESVREGATDCVLKAHLARLLPAVRRAGREVGERARRHAAEEALRRAESRFRGIFENAVEGIYQSTPQGGLLTANRAMARLCGYDSPEEFCTAVQDLSRDLYVTSGHHAEFARALDQQGEVLGHESRIKRKDGSIIWVSKNARLVPGADGAPPYFEGMVTDITARKTAEEALRQSEESFRAMAERIDHVFWIATPDVERWFYVSPAYEAIWGQPVAALYAQPRQWLESVVADDRALVRAARAELAAGRETRIEYRIRRPDGSLRWIEDRSYPVRMTDAAPDRVAGVAMDITPRKLLSSQLLQAQKMEAVGQLAGGVAHDFNNVLTVVTGYARLLLDMRTPPPDMVEPLEQIFTAGMRAANLTRQLLVFSRKHSLHRHVIDVNVVVEEIAKLIGRLIGEHIAFKLALAPATVTADVDSSMIEQVVMNLAVNARDAMPEGGTLTIATELVRIDDAATRAYPTARDGDFVCLSVRDTGCGIPPENLPRIFEPFFTTKGAMHGTGLGLATVFGIVQQHQGWIEVDSAVKGGTCFRILLPAVPAEIAAAPRRAGKAPPVRGGSETILLVEDEPGVREFGAAVLKSHGYRVLQASSGIDALAVWKWHGSRIGLLFSDLVLPDGLGGVELAARLRKEKPTLCVILTSGYAAESVEEDFRPPPGTLFLHKPYKPQVLAQTVRDALDHNLNR